MPQIHNLPNRIPEGNYREAALLNQGFMQNVFDTRQRLIKRNERATAIKNIMHKSPHLFGKGGVQLDTFGNEDKDLNKVRSQDDSRVQGPSSTTVNNEVLVNPIDVLNNPNPSKDAVMNIYNKQANRMGMPLPSNNQNTSILDTLGILGNNNIQSNNSSQGPIVDRGIKNQQQIMNGNLPLGTGTVLVPNNNQTRTPLPINSKVSASNSQGGSAGSSSSENYKLSADYKGATAEGILGSTTTVNQRTNMVDPVKKDVDDLRSMSVLHGTSFNGDVLSKNNPYTQDLAVKENYLASLNEARSKEGTFQTQERDKFKVEDKGMSASFQEGVSNSSNVSNNIRTTGASSIQNPSGGKPDYNGSLFVRGSNGKVIQVEYDGDPKDPKTLLKTDFTNSGSISFLNPDFSGMNRGEDGSLTVAKDRGEAIRNGLSYIKPQLEYTAYSLEGDDGNKIMKMINGKKEQIGVIVTQPVSGGYALSVKPFKDKWRVEDSSKFNISGTADEVKQGTGFNAGAQMDNN